MSKKKIWTLLGVLLVYVAMAWALSWFFLRESSWVPIALVFTACGVTIAAVYWLVSRLGQAKDPATSAAQAAPQPKPAAAPAVPEDRAVRELLNEAERELASAPLLASERVRPKLAELPLYILMGPEGCGKTSNFVYGELSSVALSGQVFRNEEVIPTPVANLWYVRRALVVESSGRWFTEGGARWGGFLSALRGVRKASAFRSLWQGPPPNNLRGILLLLDASDFVGIPDASKLSALARTAQDRLRTAASTFSADVPVWVIFSKADSIPFFADYFARVHEVEDQQPMGCTVDLLPANQRASMEVYAEAETRRLNETFDLLCASLSQHRLPFLARESAVGAKRGIYEFPRELKQRVRGTVVQFLVEVFRPNALQPGPLLRGFYFTGIRQAPTASGAAARSGNYAGSSDATLLMQGNALAEQEMRAALRSEPSGGHHERLKARWCFVTQLLHQVIRPDQGGARVYSSQRAALNRKIAFGAAIGLCALLCVAFVLSSWNNSTALSQLRNAGRDLQGAAISARGVSRASLENLEGMRERLAELNQWEDSRPWSMGFFLYQGNRVADRARATWERYFREYLLKPILEGYSSEFKGLPAQESDMYPYERVYDHVKTYVRLTLHDCETPQLADSLMQGWQTWKITGEGQGDLVRKQFDFYAAELARGRMPLIPGDAAALKSGQAYLNSFSEEQRLYSELVDEVSQSTPPARLADYAPKYADALTGARDIPGAFTRAGWTEMQARIADAKPKRESCVLGTSVRDRLQLLTGAALTERLHNLYKAEYGRRWKEMLKGVAVRPYSGAHDAEQKLTTLDDRTMLGLMFMVREHTQVALPAADAQSKLGALAKDLAGKKLEQSQTGRFAKQVANAVAPAAEVTVIPDPAPVFQPLTVLFAPETTNRNFNDPRNASYTKALNSLRNAMRDLADSSNPKKDDDLNKAAKKAVTEGGDAVHEFERMFNNDATEVGSQVARILTEPFTRANGQYVADPVKAGGDALNQAGAAFCTAVRPLAQKFPFLPTGPDASLDEMSKIFSPATGELSKLYAQSLSAYVARTGRTYQKLANAPGGVNISIPFLDYFSRMMRISDALFPDGSAAPGMHYRIALGQNPDVREVLFTGAGQQVSWPGGTSQKVEILMKEGNVDVPVASYEGPWAIFALMAEADRRASGMRDIGLSKIKHGVRGQPASIIVGNKEITIHLKVEEFPGGVETAFDSNFFTISPCVGKIVER